MNTRLQRRKQPKSCPLVSLNKVARSTATSISSVHPLVTLQRSIGNQALERLLLQSRDTRNVSQPNEHAVLSEVTAVIREALRPTGQPLDYATRASLEPHFGHDFNQVRVHVDPKEAESAKEVNALAHTVGQDIVFGAGQSIPGTTQGRRLRAHEIAHVPHQSQRIGMHASAAVAEHKATQAGTHAALGQPVSVHTTLSSGHQAQLQRQASTVEAPKEPPRIRRVGPEAASKDYAAASNYLTDFYSSQAVIHDDLSEAAHRAISKFTDISTIPEDRLGANVTYQLIRIVLGVLPGAGPVVGLFDCLSRGLPLAVDGARLATIAGVVAQRTAAGVYGQVTAPGGATEAQAAVRALDNLSKFATEGTDQIEEERTLNRYFLDVLSQNRYWRGRLRELIETTLGPAPDYDPASIQEFEAQYELRLYREYYGSRAHIIDWRGALIEQEIVGIPRPVLDRLVELAGTPNALDAVRVWGLKVERRYLVGGMESGMSQFP